MKENSENHKKNVIIEDNSEEHRAQPYEKVRPVRRSAELTGQRASSFFVKLLSDSPSILSLSLSR